MSSIFEFGPYRLLAQEGRLLRGDEPVAVTAKVLATLLVLVRHPGQTVSKQELMDGVWPGMFVEESNLAQNISVLRKTLGDASYIETIPKVGYRFIVEVREIRSEPEPAALPTPPLAAVPSQWRIWWLASACTVLLAGIIYLFVANWRSAPDLPGVRRSVAVLSFRDLSGKPENVWLGRALAEMLNTELGSDSRVRTISGEETARIQSDFGQPERAGVSRETLARIHTGSGVDCLVSGALLPLGGDLRLDLQVQDASTGEAIGVVSETGAQSRLPDLAEKVAGRIRKLLRVGDLRVAAKQAARAAIPVSPEAQKLYADGLERLRLFDGAAAEPLLTRAVSLDSEFPLAHAALANAWIMLGFDSRAEAEAQRADELSGRLPERDRKRIRAARLGLAGQWDKVIAIYSELAAAQPDDVEMALALARAQTSGGKPASAAATIAKLRALEAAKNDPRIAFADAEAAVARGDFAAAEKSILTALAQSRQASAKTIEGRSLVLQARLRDRAGDRSAGQIAANQAVALCAAAGDFSCVAQALSEQGNQDRTAGNFKQARETTERAMAILRRTGDRRNLADCLLRLAEIEMAEHKYNGARSALQEVLALSQETGSQALNPRALGLLANIEARTGAASKAANLVAEQESSAQNVEGDKQRVVALDSRGRLQVREGDLAGAQKSYEEALRLKKTAASRLSYAYTLGLLAQVYGYQGKLALATKTREEECSIVGAVGQASRLVSCQLAMARLDLERGRADRALATAREIAEKSKGAAVAITANRVVAQALLALKRPQEAEAAIEQAAALNKGKDDKLNFDVPIAIDRGRVSLALGRTKEAASALQSAVEGAKEVGSVPLQFEARLGLAEVAYAANDPGAPELTSLLLQEARDRGFSRISRRASQLRNTPRK